jgi:major membrane immunogen (membrane-anchored lipoprotein)
MKKSFSIALALQKAIHARHLLVLLTIASLFTACSKRDIIKWMEKQSRCDLADQTSVFQGGEGPIEKKLFTKTYYPNGLVKTLNVTFSEYFGNADTLEYLFEYSKNQAIAHVKSTTRDGTKTNYDVAVTFDPETGYATKLGNEVVVYEGKKMKSYGLHTFSYDANGNLSEFRQLGGSVKVKYEYDLTKPGGQYEFYTSLDIDALGSTFSMAEVMGWIPTSGSANRRVKKTLLAGEYVLGEESYSDHQYKNGKLVEFKTAGVVIKNTWKCK